MNRTIKRCLLGLVATATLFGTTWVQGQEPAGSVQLGPNAQAPQPAPVATPPQFQMQLDPQAQFPADPGVTTLGGNAQAPGMLAPRPFPYPATGNFSQSGQPGPAGTYQMTPIDQIMQPRFFIDSRGGGLYGYNAGYSNIGGFMPYKIDNTSLFYASGQALITYDGRGGATVGAGWRHWMEELDRIIGLAVFADFDNGHAQPYQQLGFSFESLGRYADLRVNGYAPLGNTTHVLNTRLTNVATLNGNGINLGQINTIEQSYGGFDAEIGGPTPILGRYGLNAYIGGYYFMSNGAIGGNFTGVSGRLLSQINEDVSFGVQVTDDNAFGLNTQFQVFVNLPNGRPSRWMRNLKVQDRLVQNVFRQNRVIAKEFVYTSQVAAIDPNSHKPYFVANIDPNAPTNGNGTAASPFQSIAAYEAQSVAQQKQYDLILVRPGSVATNGNLNTNSAYGSTLDIYNNQRLLSTSTSASIFTANLPGVAIPVPGLAAGNSPLLTNSGGNDVVTLVGGNTQIEQVSGFQISGNGSGNGIAGNHNTAVTIDHNNISGGANGVFLQNLSGTIAASTQAIFVGNTIQNNLGNGIQITNSNAAPLEVVVTGNTFSSNGADGLRMDASAGSSIGGIIGGANIANSATTPGVTRSNTFDSNTGNGLDLTANNGTLNFNDGSKGFAIINNTFTSNGINGLNISTTGGSTSTFNIINNTFGSAFDSTVGNKVNGINVATDSGSMTLLIGGQTSKNADGSTNNPGNFFYNNGVNAITVNAIGTAALTYNIDNNTITNPFTSNFPPPKDTFDFVLSTVATTGSTTGGTGDPFTLTNNSTIGRTTAATITGMSLNLVGSGALFNATSEVTPFGATTIVQPPTGDNLLTSVNNIAVNTGQNPLTLAGAGALPANDTNLGIQPYGQNLGLGFSKQLFTTGTTFTATSQFIQGDHQHAATGANLVGTKVSVTFSDNRTATGTLKLEAGSTTTLEATGLVFGSLSPGYGTGNDGIHVTTAGSATMHNAYIQNNTVTGVGGTGIFVGNSGSQSSSSVNILNNTLQFNGTGVNSNDVPTFTGGGITVSQFGTSSTASFNALIENNLVNSNFNNGITVLAGGLGTMVVNSNNNAGNDPSTDPTNPKGNAGNGLCVSASGSNTLTFNSIGDNFSGNGIGSGVNPASTGGDNIAVITNDTATAKVFFNNTTSSNAAANGLSATTNNGSTLNLTLGSPTTTGTLAFQNNSTNGLHLTTNDQSLLNLNIFNTAFVNNGTNGILFNRNGASLVLANITNSTMSSNGANGLSWLGIGSDESDPTQRMTGTSNQINLIGDKLNGNGTSGVGDGALIDAFGQSSLVMNALVLNPNTINAQRTTFDNNVGSGVSIDETPGAEFGNPLGNQRSTFDGVDISNNGSNGIQFASEISGTPISDVASRTYFQLTSVNAITNVSFNKGNGIALEYNGGHLTDSNGNYDTVHAAHDILVQGNSNNGLYIQSNGIDGVHADIGNYADATLTVDTVTIGGSALTAGGLPGKTEPAGNGGNGIFFGVEMSNALPTSIQTIDEKALLYTYMNAYERAGSGTLNVNNSFITNNTLNGIELYGNGLVGTGLGAAGNLSQRTYNTSADGYGNINANVTNNTITNNGQSGVFIQLLGRMGSDKYPTLQADTQTNIYNNLTFSNNTISNNGNFGIYIEQNASQQFFTTEFGWAYGNFDKLFYPPPATLPSNFPIQVYDPVLSGLTFDYNNALHSYNLIKDGIYLSNWMSLETAQATNLVLTNNTIQGNGQNHNLSTADAVKIRVGTDTYLSANITGNNLTGNVGNSLYVESFTQYNPVTNVSIKLPLSTHGGDTTPDGVFLDYTAQLYMNLVNNVGNAVNIASPMVNYSATLPGNVSSNGAFYGNDPQKNPWDNIPNINFPGQPTSSGGPIVDTLVTSWDRLVQLFEINNGNNLNTTNTFISNGVTQDLQSAFYNGDFYLQPTNNGNFPGTSFPQNYATSPGNPFLP